MFQHQIFKEGKVANSRTPIYGAVFFGEYCFIFYIEKALDEIQLLLFERRIIFGKCVLAISHNDSKGF